MTDSSGGIRINITPTRAALPKLGIETSHQRLVGRGSTAKPGQHDTVMRKQPSSTNSKVNILPAHAAETDRSDEGQMLVIRQWIKDGARTIMTVDADSSRNGRRLLLGLRRLCARRRRRSIWISIRPPDFT
jgi:hypothetical protein